MDPRPRSPPPERRDRIASSSSIEIKRSTPREHRDRTDSERVSSPRGTHSSDSREKEKSRTPTKKDKDKDKIEPSPVKDLDIDDKRSRRLSGALSKESRDDPSFQMARSPGPKSHKKLDLLRGTRERSNSLPMLQASPMGDDSTKDEEHPSTSKRISRQSSKAHLASPSPVRERSRGALTPSGSSAHDEHSQDERGEDRSDSGSISNTPGTTSSTNSPAPGSMLMHRSPRPDGKVVVSSGTVDELIQQLATDQMPDKEYLEQFLLSHPYFLDSVELLIKLLDRFFDPEQSGGATSAASSAGSTPNASPSRLASSPSMTRLHGPSAAAIGKQSRVFIQLRVVNAIKKWIELNIDDWDRVELQKQFQQGIDRMKGEGGHADQWATHLTDALKRSRENRSKPPEGDLSRRPKPVLPKNLGTRVPVLTDFNPVELARQITIVEHEMFRKIPLASFYHKSWTSTSGPGVAINALIKRFNTISYWVATEVVTLASHKQRSAMIGHLIEMAHAFADLNNYNGLMEMLSGLNMTPVQRLKLAWAGVEPRQMKLLDNLNKMMDPLSNWQVYRQTLKDTNPPCLPFMGLFLTDLTFVEENVSHLANGLVNFDKMSLLGRIFCELRRCQAVPYNLEPVILVQEFVSKAKTLEEDVLYESSKKCEPSASSAE